MNSSRVLFIYIFLKRVKKNIKRYSDDFFLFSFSVPIELVFKGIYHVFLLLLLLLLLLR